MNQFPLSGKINDRLAHFAPAKSASQLLKTKKQREFRIDSRRDAGLETAALVFPIIRAGKDAVTGIIMPRLRA